MGPNLELSVSSFPRMFSLSGTNHRPKLCWPGMTYSHAPFFPELHPQLNVKGHITSPITNSRRVASLKGTLQPTPANMLTNVPTLLDKLSRMSSHSKALYRFSKWQWHLNLIFTDCIGSRAETEMLKSEECPMCYWVSRMEHWLELDQYALETACPAASVTFQRDLSLA